MELLQTLLTVIFVISSILLILLILIQNSRSGGMGLFGGGAQTAFGASSGDVLTKFTGVLVAVFLILAITLAYLKSQESGLSGIEKELGKTEAGTKGNPTEVPADAEASGDKKADEKTTAPVDQSNKMPKDANSTDKPTASMPQ